MIYGVVAEQGEQLAVPITALGVFDFVGGSYNWGGTSLTASQVVDQTGWIGASGLAVPGSAAAGASILYAATTTLLAACQFTAVISVETLNTSQNDTLTVTNSGESFYVQLATIGTTEYFVNDNDGSTSRFAENFDNLSLGIHKIAFTRTDAHASISVDSGTVVTDTTSVTLPVIGFPMVNFFLGGFSGYTGGAINIRSVAFLNPQTDADLRLLPALPPVA